MSVEISANRLMAPAFGNSIYTWTALISVILVALSLGNYLGGKWVDRPQSHKHLIPSLLILAALSVALCPVLFSWLQQSLTSQFYGILLGPLLMCMVLFVIPGILLGSLPPICVALLSQQKQFQQLGSTSGWLSMLGTLGSFVGTIITGFYLLSILNINYIFWLNSGILTLLATLGFFLNRDSTYTISTALSSLFIPICISAMHYSEDIDQIYQEDSFYHQITILERKFNNETIRRLQLDTTHEGGVNMADGTPVFEYQKYWQIWKMISKDLDHALVIGAGAYGVPCDIAKQFPSSKVDVIEIDPSIVSLGTSHFKAGVYPNIKSHIGDARVLLNQQQPQQWQLIFGDAYHGVNQIPNHLVTLEFFQLIRKNLHPDGLFILNTINFIEGPKSEMHQTFLSTLKSVFPHLHVFAVLDPKKLNAKQNVIIVASLNDRLKQALEQYYPSNSWQQNVIHHHLPTLNFHPKGHQFTDQLNSIDLLLANSI